MLSENDTHTSPQYCASSFLTFRYVIDPTMSFHEGLKVRHFVPDPITYSVANADEVEEAIKSYISEICAQGGKIGLALSGGIDSAILARYVPKDTVTYTFRCIAPQAMDESHQARIYAEECGLEHRIIDITWEDYMNCIDALMMHKGAPIHSIEPQIYTAAMRLKKDGITHFLFGECADTIFGGLDGLLAKDWEYDEFITRFAYLNPEKILREGEMVTKPFEKYRKGNTIDAYSVIANIFYLETNSSYENACSLVGIRYAAPYNRMRLSVPLEMERIRSGENKYILRELFHRLYPQFEQPQKTPMPRAVKQWLEAWPGPTRPEFIPGCAKGLSGDQRWMVYILERFLNLIEHFHGEENKGKHD